MTSENLWPVVSLILQRAFIENRRKWLSEASEQYPNVRPWPQRRSRKRKPIPGLLEALEPEG